MDSLRVPTYPLGVIVIMLHLVRCYGDAIRLKTPVRNKSQKLFLKIKILSLPGSMNLFCRSIATIFFSEKLLMFFFSFAGTCAWLTCSLRNSSKFVYKATN